ncbi:MAG TPA: oligosaccharide flippase family protein, partial [Longimicrobiaceae bacterium]|nr:oligosaccharide flippase family protein [Longimicrobiaceae bacterium]
YALVTFLAAPLVAAFFNEPRLVPIIRVLSVNFLFIAAFTLPQSLLVRELDFRRKARVEVIGTIAGAGVSLMLALLGYGVWALVGSIFTVNLLKAVLFQWTRPVPVGLPRRFRALQPLVGFGLVLSLDRILFFAYGQVDIAIGGRVLGTEAIGLYAVALSLAAMPMEKVIPTITQVSFAAFSRIQEDRERVNRNVLRAAQVVSLGAYPLYFGLVATAPHLIPWLLGARWSEAVLPLQIVCLILPLKALAALLSPALFGIGRPGVNVVNMAFSAVTMAAAFLVGVRYGVIGLCLAWLFVYPGVFAVTTVRALRALRLPPRELLRVIVFPALVSSGMLGLVFLLDQLLRPHLARLPLLLVLVGAGTSFYCTIVWVWRRQSIEELRLAFRAS